MHGSDRCLLLLLFVIETQNWQKDKDKEEV